MFTKRSFALWLVTISLGVCTTALCAPIYIRPWKRPASELFDRLGASVDEDQPFQLLVRIHLEPGTEEKFLAEAAKAAKETAGEPGCEMYAFFKDLEETAAVILFEKWKNAAALKAHMERPHTVAFLKLLDEIQAEPEIRILNPLPSLEPTP